MNILLVLDAAVDAVDAVEISKSFMNAAPRGTRVFTIHRCSIPAVLSHDLNAVRWDTDTPPYVIILPVPANENELTPGELKPIARLAMRDSATLLALFAPRPAGKELPSTSLEELISGVAPTSFLVHGADLQDADFVSALVRLSGFGMFGRYRWMDKQIFHVSRSHAL